MVEVFHLILALGLPWLMGALLCCACWYGKAPGYWAVTLGMGFPLGMVGVIGIYIFLGMLNLELHFLTNLLAQCIAIAVAALILSLRIGGQQSSSRGSISIGEWASMRAGWKIFIVLLVSWLVLRWVGIVLEVVYRPLYPWDAWSGYGVEAKLWFYQPYFNLPIVEGWQWFERQGLAWTGGTKHASGVALIQLWVVQVLGRWDDSLMNLAWPMLLVSIGLMIFGLLRMAGAGLVSAIVWVFLILSLPMLNVQAVLAGYADLWVASLLLACTGASYTLFRFKEPWLLLVVSVGLVGLLLLKQHGMLWAALVVVSLFTVWQGVRLAGVAACLIGIVIGVLWYVDASIYLGPFGRFGFRQGNWILPGRLFFVGVPEFSVVSEMLRHWFVYPNWHLFWYLAPVFFIGSIRVVRMERETCSVAILGWVGLFVLVALMTLTRIAPSIVDGTSINRLLLHLVPSLGFLWGLIATFWQRSFFRSNPGIGTL